MPKILYLEDDSQLDSIPYILNGSGHTVSWFKGIASALESIKLEHYDLIIVDVMMDLPDRKLLPSNFTSPLNAGIDFVEFYRSKYPDVPIIVTSGRHDLGSMAQKFSVSRVLVKPVSVSEIGALISELLN